jgi:hypothetical protein
MDRIYLIASAITKAFRDGDTHARYLRLGDAPEPEGCVMHLTGEEQRLIVDALILQRNQALENTQKVEQLLQRSTGGVIEFINETGARPLQISEIDRAELAVRDGDLSAFRETFPRLTEDEAAHMLPQTAGRPGSIGAVMTRELLEHLPAISSADYLHACEQAVEIGDTDRTKFLLEQADRHVRDLNLSFYGEVIRYAFLSTSENRRGIKMAQDLVESCTPEQIAAADPQMLVHAANCEQHRLVRDLVSKGIDANACAAELIRTLDRHREGWQVASLLGGGMHIDTQNYAALAACIDTGNAEAAEILLRQGMDFDGYTAWAEKRNLTAQNPVLESSLRDLWEQELRPPTPEQEITEPEMRLNL